jgi:hypothetical protein
MTKRKLAGSAVPICAATVALALSIGAQNKTGAATAVAKGSFDVKMTPVDPAHKDEKAIARYSLEKVYRGDLEGTGTGEMLASMGTVKESGTYVAMEVVSGLLAGKKGTFALAHVGTMTRGAQDLSIRVVPDSGTGELAGIKGKMNIIIAPEGKHSYEFEYRIEKE